MHKLFVIYILMFPALSVANTHHNTWDFNVYLNNDLIGDHSFVVSGSESEKSVMISANFDVRFLFFSAYNYQHDNIETWQGQCVKKVSSFTDDNGDIIKLMAKKSDAEMVVNVNDKVTVTKQPCIKSFAYWDPSILNEKYLFNSQTGEYMSVEIKDMGGDTIEIKSRAVESRRYQIISSEFTIDLWYSPEGEWLSLHSTTKDGHLLEYRLK